MQNQPHSPNRLVRFVSSLAGTLILTAVGVSVAEASPVRTAVPSSVSASAGPDTFDLLVVVRNASQTNTRAVVLHDFDAGVSGKARAWLTVSYASPDHRYDDRGTAILRVMTSVDGEKSQKVLKGGFYRIQGTVEHEFRCVNANNCMDINYLDVRGASKAVGTTGGCSFKTPSVGRLLTRATAYITACAGPDGIYVNSHGGDQANSLAEVQVTGLSIKPRRGKAATVPITVPDRFSLSDGPAFIATALPGNSVCTLTVVAWIDSRDDGMDYRAAKSSRFSFRC